MTRKTPEEIRDAIVKALEETAARLAAAGPKPVLYPLRFDQTMVRGRPKTPREILDAINNALKETARRLAERGC